MTKEMKIGVGLAAVIIVLFATLFFLNSYNYNRSLIREKDPNLTQDERKIYEDRLAQAETELAKPDLTEQSKYDLHMYKGFQLYGLGKLEESLVYYSQASQIMPEDHTSYVAMYTTQMDMNDVRGAQRSIRKALELKPTDPDIWKKYILLEKEVFKTKNEQIKNMYIDALEQTQGHVDIVTSYAVFLESIGELEPAKAQWELAITLNPQASELYQQEITRLEQKMQAQ